MPCGEGYSLKIRKASIGGGWGEVSQDVYLTAGTYYLSYWARVNLNDYRCDNVGFTIKVDGSGIDGMNACGLSENTWTSRVVSFTVASPGDHTITARMSTSVGPYHLYMTRLFLGDEPYVDPLCPEGVAGLVGDCPGTELLTDTTTISAGETLYESKIISGYEDMIVTAYFKNAYYDDLGFVDVDMTVKGQTTSLSSYFYEPYVSLSSASVAGPDVTVGIENVDTKDVDVVSLCAEPISLSDPYCVNPDPGLFDAGSWNYSDGVEHYLLNLFRMDPGSRITRNVTLAPGVYSLIVDAGIDDGTDSYYSSLQLGLDDQTSWVDIPPWPVRRSITVTAESTGTHTLNLTAASSDDPDMLPISLDYVCLREYEPLDEDPPDPDPPEYDCLNPDPNVNYPLYWTETNTVTWTGDYTTLSPEIAGIDLIEDYEFWVPPGDYRLSFEARSADDATGFVTSDAAANMFFSLTGDGVWNDYTTDFSVSSGVSSTIQFQRLDGLGNVDLRWLCLTEIESTGDDPPTVSNCINRDPDFEEGWTHWVPLGDVAQTDSIITLSPGEAAYQYVHETNAEDHYAQIVARASTTASIDVEWQDINSLYLPANEWVTGTIQLDIEPGQTLPQQLKVLNLDVADVEVHSVCLRRAGDTPGPDPRDYEMWRPLCDRDWITITNYTSGAMMQVGQGQVGMPVHNTFAGQSIFDPDATTVLTDAASNVYTNCLIIAHDYYMPDEIYSVYCGLEEIVDEAYGAPLGLARGQVLGYTGSTYSGNLWFGMVVGHGGTLGTLPLGGDWIDPMQSLSSKHPDCVPYRVALPRLDECGGDDGNGGWIAPRNNTTQPASTFWDAQEWLEWQLDESYDNWIYPTLCLIVDVINDIINAIEVAINAIIDALSPIFSFIYRVARLLSHLLERVIDLMTALVAYFREMTVLGRCTGDLVAYFVEAFTQAASAEKDIDALNPSNSVVASMGVMFSLLQSTIANIILLPVTGLIVAWGSWNLIPWGLRHLRKAFEKGD